MIHNGQVGIASGRKSDHEFYGRETCLWSDAVAEYMDYSINLGDPSIITVNSTFAFSEDPDVKFEVEHVQPWSDTLKVRKYYGICVMPLHMWRQLKVGLRFDLFDRLHDGLFWWWQSGAREMWAIVEDNDASWVTRSVHAKEVGFSQTWDRIRDLEA